MKYHISSSLFVLFCIVLCACNSSSVEKDGIIQPAFDLIERQIGERAADIQLEEIAPENGKETFEVEAKNGILTLRGSSSVAICYAFHTYLREACSAMKTWSGERMELPETWPDFVLKKQTTPYEYRYFLNVCTFGYTTPYWDWERWEKEIDWMALRGVNMPLATGFFYRPGTFAVASYGESEWLGRPAYGRLAKGADKTATQDIESNA